MAAVNQMMNSVFSTIWSPFSQVSPWIGLTVLSVVLGILALLCYKYTSNQARISYAKDQYKGHLLAVWLFRDEVLVVTKSLGRTMGCLGIYLGHNLRPMAVMLIPFTLVFAQMMMHLGYVPRPVGEKFNLSVSLADSVDPAALTALEFSAPPGIEVLGRVRVLEENRVVYSLVPREAGNMELEFRLPKESVRKTLCVAAHGAPAADLLALSGIRSASFADQVLFPTEPSLSKDSAFAKIEFEYPIRPLRLLGVDWSFGSEVGLVVLVVVISIVAALLLKGFFGVTL